MMTTIASYGAGADNLEVAFEGEGALPNDAGRVARADGENAAGV